MNWRDYIVSDPEIFVGKPVMKGARLSVDLILDRLLLSALALSVAEKCWIVSFCG